MRPKILIVISARNEEDFIESTLISLRNQTIPIAKIVIVDDASDDNMVSIIKSQIKLSPHISLIRLSKNQERSPGAKIIKNFNFGLSKQEFKNFDFIAKLDADLIFPNNYFEKLLKLFDQNDKLGLAGGICLIEKQGQWIPEVVSKSDHVRGALKFYRKEAFEEIGGLDEVMGWDSLDEFKLGYHGWGVQVDPNLQVKHLRVTNRAVKWRKIESLNGKMFYDQRFGLVLAFLSCMKRGIKHKPFVISGLYAFKAFLINYLGKQPPFVSKPVGQYIRKYRWSNVFKR